MKVVIGFLTLIILTGAGCVATEPSTISPVDSTVDTSSTTDSDNDTTAESPETTGTTWVMSTGIVMFTAPDGWSVSQSDGGGVSGIRVYSGDREVRITIELQEDGSVEVSTEVSNDDSEELRAIIDSIVINPSAELRADATIIP